jgi:hypothetical protein
MNTQKLLAGTWQTIGDVWFGKQKKKCNQIFIYDIVFLVMTNKVESGGEFIILIADTKKTKTKCYFF